MIVIVMVIVVVMVLDSPGPTHRVTTVTASANILQPFKTLVR